MSKYDVLTRHLKEMTEGNWEASFVDIERILGFKLPDSAREYPAWWANQLTGQRVQCRSWMNAGWQANDLDLDGEKITFHRVDGSLGEDVAGHSLKVEAQSLPDVVREAKLQISRAAGVVSDKVTISIDY